MSTRPSSLVGIPNRFGLTGAGAKPVGASRKPVGAFEKPPGAEPGIKCDGITSGRFGLDLGYEFPAAIRARPLGAGPALNDRPGGAGNDDGNDADLNKC